MIFQILSHHPECDIRGKWPPCKYGLFFCFVLFCFLYHLVSWTVNFPRVVWSVWAALRTDESVSGWRETADRPSVFVLIPPPTFSSLSLCSLRHQDTGNKPPQAAHVDSCRPPLSRQQEGLDSGCRGHVCLEPKSTLLQKTGVCPVFYNDLQPPWAPNCGSESDSCLCRSVYLSATCRPKDFIIVPRLTRITEVKITLLMPSLVFKVSELNNLNNFSFQKFNCSRLSHWLHWCTQ